MFERYTERARRVLFFARYEASQLGSRTIETEHLLLGLLREGQGLTARLFGRAHLSFGVVEEKIRRRSQLHGRISTSVEIPFSSESKNVLRFAAEEADRLQHHYIGTEHLLLGILRDERSGAASILTGKGMRLHAVRENIVELLKEAADDVEQTGEPNHRPSAGGTHPHYLPSRVVHISYSKAFYSPTAPHSMVQGADSWFALGLTLTQSVALAWGSDESRVKLADERLDGNARYDFTIVLPPTDSREIIPRLLREAIERDFDVEVTREEGEPPALIITSR